MSEPKTAQVHVSHWTRGHDGIVRPGPESYVDGCPSNECQIRRQCAGVPCRGQASMNDLVLPGPAAGVTLVIDHPRGELRWELPLWRAEELIEAIRMRLDRTARDSNARSMIITITCDRAGCPAAITLLDQDQTQEAIDAALRSLGWTVTVGTVRRYHACVRCAG